MVRALGLVLLVACSSTSQPTGATGPAGSATAGAAPAARDAGPADATSLDQDLPRLVARSLAMYRDVAAAFEASARDCAAATGQLRRLATVHREVVTANAKVLHDGRAAALRAALAPHDDELATAAGAVMHAPTMAACAPDAAFSHALDELFAPP